MEQYGLRACLPARHTGWRDRGPYIFELFKVNFLPGQDDYPHTSCFTTQIGSKAKHAVHAEPPLPRPKLFASASETVKCTRTGTSELRKL